MKTKTHLLALATACAAAALFAVAEDAESAPTAEERKASAEAVPSSDEDNASGKGSGDEGFARYQSIIDRQPFGPPPPGFDPSLPAGQAGAGGANGADGKTEAEISAEEQKLMSSVRVSILNVTPAGAVMAGFTDSTTQPPVNYYLKVGDTSTDAAKWTVKEADPAAGTVTLSKDGIDVTLAVGGETKKGSSAKSAAQGGRHLAAAGSRSGRGIFPGRGPSPAPPPGFGSPPIAGGEDAEKAQDAGGALARLRQRRMLKHAEEAAQKQAAEKARANLEAQEAKEKEELAREREQAAADRAQQREALRQIQEELRRNREAKAAQNPEESSEEQPE